MLELRVNHAFRMRGGFRLDVDLTTAGPVTGVFGASGSGKTTLLNAVCGLLRPRAGRIALDGHVLCDRERRTWVPPERRRTALVSQGALLFPHRSVRANLCWAPGARRRLASGRGAVLLDVLRLGPLLERGVNDLSGERQRVAIGRALLADPQLLLLDEPTAALDAPLARDVLGLCSRIARELETPTLFVTHKADELLALADDCLVLEAGRVVAHGPPLEVLARPTSIGIANLVGVDNLLRLPILRHDPAGGVTHLDLGGAELVAPLADAAPGTLLDVGLYADELILCIEPPTGISARNVLPARVERVDTLGHEVLVRLRVGEAALLSRVTPSAVSELRLRTGQELVAVIKTSACHLLGLRSLDATVGS